MFSAFPLQHKRLQCLRLPWMTIGSCSVMNSSTHYDMGSFMATNPHNRGLYADLQEGIRAKKHWQFGDMVSAGLADSYTGPACSTFTCEYLRRALSLHTAVPGEAKLLRKTYGDLPLFDIMDVALKQPHRGGRTTSHVSGSPPPLVTQPVTDWEMRQYALLADFSFFKEHRFEQAGGSNRRPPPRRVGNQSPRLEHFGGEGAAGNSVSNSGCRAVWFSASLVPEEPAQASGNNGPVAPKDREEDLTLDVVSSNVGDARCFGIARHPRTKGIKSALDSSRERVYPLSADHKPSRAEEYRRIIQAGGKTGGEHGDCIDDNPYLNVSRSFGHHFMKNDPDRSPMDQKMSAMPSSFSWTMRQGDILVMANHGVYETRTGVKTSVDDAAKVVAKALDKGHSPEEAAAALCDYAMEYGAIHSLQVVVAVAGESAEEVASDGIMTDRIAPGPVYAEPCRMLPEYYSALLEDCRRCGIPLPYLLQLRWESVKEHLDKRHSLPFLGLYPKECGALRHIMEEEATLFGNGPESTIRDSPDESDENRDARFFSQLAKSLAPAQRRQSNAAATSPHH